MNRRYYWLLFWNLVNTNFFFFLSVISFIVSTIICLNSEEKTVQFGCTFFIALFSLLMCIFCFIEFDSYDYRKAKKITLLNFIECYEEDGVYYYTIFDRFIVDSKYKLSESDEVYFAKSKLVYNKLENLPVFKTRAKIREEKLDMLL